MKISNVALSRTGADTFRASDNAGTLCDVKYCYSDHDTHVIYAEGSYNGPAVQPPVRARCVLVLKSGYMQETDGRYYVTSRMDTFIQIDHAGRRTAGQDASAAACIARPITISSRRPRFFGHGLAHGRSQPGRHVPPGRQVDESRDRRSRPLRRVVGRHRPARPASGNRSRRRPRRRPSESPLAELDAGTAKRQSHRVAIRVSAHWQDAGATRCRQSEARAAHPTRLPQLFFGQLVTACRSSLPVPNSGICVDLEEAVGRGNPEIGQSLGRELP